MIKSIFQITNLLPLTLKIHYDYESFPKNC